MPKILGIKNLRGIYSGQGFDSKDGRKVAESDAGFIPGPVDILWDETGIILKVGTKVCAHLTPHQVADGSELIATAGWVDSHTHTLFGGDRWAEFFLRWAGSSYIDIARAGGGIRSTQEKTFLLTLEQLEAQTSKQLQKMLLQGTTTVEIKTGYGRTANEELTYLRILKRLKTRFPIKATFLGLHSLPKDGRSEEAYVDEMISCLPLIKQEGLADFVDAFPDDGFFSLNSAERFFRSASEHQIKSRIHSDELAPWNTSLKFAQLGSLSVDHLQHVSSEAISYLGQSNTVATLLPATSFYLGLSYAPARKLISAGAKVALATDFNPGTAPNDSLQFTALLAASQFKMSPTEILCSITKNAADSLELKNAGVVKTGYRADLCFWESNSLEDILLSQKNPRRVTSSGVFQEPISNS